MAYFLGIDSGGTKTECWLGNESRVLAQAVTGTVKLTRINRQVATERLCDLLHQVSFEAQVPLSQVRRACIGVAGYSISEVRAWAAETVGGLVGGEVMVCGDDEIALDSAFFGGPGILIISGTGSAVLGRAADGSRFKAGGWGPGIGDEGSGFWIGREALRRAFSALDAGQPCCLLQAILTAWEAKDLDTVVAIANARPGPDLAALTPLVIRCAEEGDAVAKGLLADAGDWLARQVAIVWEKMQAHGERSASVAYTGSVVEKVRLARQAMREGVTMRCRGLNLLEAAVNPLEGAMWRARGNQAAANLPEELGESRPA